MKWTNSGNTTLGHHFYWNQKEDVSSYHTCTVPQCLWISILSRPVESTNKTPVTLQWGQYSIKTIPSLTSPAVWLQHPQQGVHFLLLISFCDTCTTVYTSLSTPLTLVPKLFASAPYLA